MTQMVISILTFRIFDLLTVITDPLNLPEWRKAAALIAICLCRLNSTIRFLPLLTIITVGAMAAAAELILGALLPVFVLQYAGLDPKILQKIHLPPGLNSLVVLKELSGPPIWKVFFLASLPILMIGVSNFFLVPLAIIFGRRPVILVSGLIAIGGAIWAGFSTSLDSHLGARAIQAIGAGTVESLIPFIISDMVFLHQRNKAISIVFGIQGLLVVVLGVATPWIVIRLNWHWVYWITAAAAGFFWVGVVLFLPETRYHRTSNEMSIPHPA